MSRNAITATRRADADAKISRTPLGYRAGFSLRASSNGSYAIVYPGQIEVLGLSLSLDAQYIIAHSDWTQGQAPNTTYYVYVDKTKSFYVRTEEPEFSSEFFSDYHPTFAYRYVGRIKLGANKEIIEVVSASIEGIDVELDSSITNLTVTGDLIVGGYTMSTYVKSLLDNVDADAFLADLNLETGLASLTATEISQLQNIDATTISAAQWGYLGGMNQDLATTDSPTFAGLTTGGTVEAGEYTEGGSATLSNDISGVAATATALATARTISLTGDVTGSQTFDGTANAAIAATVVEAQVNHDLLANFVANEHVDHTSVTLSAGSGLTGGGTIAASRTFNVGEGTGISVAADAISTNDSEIVHDNLSGFVADEHVAHGGVTLTAGTGLSGGGTIASSRTFALDLNELGVEAAIAAGDFIAMVDITDNGSQKITFANFESTLNHNSLAGFVANEHVDHSGVSVIAGTLLTGGGAITGNVTLNVDEASINHDALTNFVANEHINHTTVSVSGGGILSGGGTIAANRTITLAHADVDHDQTTNFVGDEHVAHSWVSITAGTHLTGGGTIASTRTLNVDLSGATLDEIGDVTITSIAAGELLEWSGSAWINQTLAELGISETSHTHDDRYYTETELNNGQLDTRYYTESEVDSEIDSDIATHAALVSSVHGISAYGATLVDDANAAAARTTLGVYSSVEVDALTWTAGDIVSGTFANARISQSSVTQHENAINHDALLNFATDEHVAHSGVTLTAGNGLSGGGTIASNRSFTIDLNELGVETGIVAADYVIMVDATDNGSQKITFANFEGDLNHNSLSGFVSDEHVAHSSVTLTAGNGLTGGGTIAASRSFAVGAGTGITVAANTVSTNDSEIVHDDLSGFVGDEHVAHSGVMLTAGTGLTGGGTLSANRSFALTAGVQASLTLADSSVQSGDDVSDLVNDAGYITATLTTEEVQDVVGAMLSGNTETRITVTYQDGDGTIDFVVDNDLSHYSNTTSAFITAVGVTYENLSANSDIGTGSTQVSQGDHTHDGRYYTESEVDALTWVASSIVSGTFANARISESSVTQHYAAIFDDGDIADIGDVTITTIAVGELLKWSGTAWINNTLTEAGISATGHTHTESDITDLNHYTSSDFSTDFAAKSTTDLSEGTNLYYTSARADARIAAADLDDIGDVTITSIASGEVLKWNGSAWINNTLAEAGISATSHVHAATDVTSGTFADTRISQSSVTQHEGTLTIAASQVTEISNLTAVEGAQLENIGVVTISNAQWGYLGALNQPLTTTSNVTFGDVIATGDLDVTGATTLSSTLNVDGTVSITGIIQHTGDTDTHITFTTNTITSDVGATGDHIIQVAGSTIGKWNEDGLNIGSSDDPIDNLSIVPTAINKGLSIYGGTNTVVQLQKDGGSDGILRLYDDNSGTENVRLRGRDSADNFIFGNVGIGTNSPVYKLDVRSSAPAIFFGQTDAITGSMFRLRANAGATTIIDITADGDVEIGGGYGSTGVTIEADGDIFTDGQVGIGTDSVQVYNKLTVKQVRTNGVNSGALFDVDPEYAGTGSYYTKGIDIQIRPTGSGLNTGYTIGAYSSVLHNGAATLSAMHAFYGQYGTFTGGTGTVTNAFGLNLQPYSSGGTVTNAYGVYINVGSGATNNWGIYVAGNQKNYFGGTVDIIGDFTINTNKFTVAAATGNTVVAGTLGIGAFTIPNTDGSADEVLITDGAGNLSWSTMAAAGSGTVTSVSAGNGMDFTTITSSGSVTMGTPSTLTSATSNALTTTSHTHAITNYALSGTANQITVTGAGKILGAAVTLSLPTTITGLTSITSTNFVGTLSTAAQTNITSVGTLSSLAVTGNLIVDTDTLYVNTTNDAVAINTTPYNFTGGGYTGLLSLGSYYSFIGTNNMTNTTDKTTRIGVPHYTIAEEPFCGVLMQTKSAANRLLLGGGTAYGNAATEINFYTAANTTTTTGTQRAEFDSNGSFRMINLADTSTATQKTDTTKNAIIFETPTYTADYYIPGIVWTTLDNSPTKPKVAMWTQMTSTGSHFFLGTSNTYATGVTNEAISINENGYTRVLAGVAKPVGDADGDECIRNIFVDTTDPASGDGDNGDVWLKYS